MARLRELNIRSQEDFERALRAHPDLAEQVQRALLARDPRLATLQALTEARSPQEVLRAARAHPMLLSDETLEQIRGIIANARAQGEEGMARHLEARLETLTQFKQSGIALSDLGWLEQLAQNPELASVFQELAKQGITSPEQLEQALRDRPDLREKLERAAAVGGQPSAVGEIPAELRPLLAEMTRLRRLAEMPRKIELCEQALRLVRREENPPLWAALQSELANALNQNPQGSRADNLERAIGHYEQALQVRTREAFPTDWAMTQNNLANAYKDRIRGERAENVERAIGHYEQALQVYTPQAYPGDARKTARNLGNLHTEIQNWQGARSGYAIALAAAEQLFRHSVDPTTQRAEAEELADLYDRDINACVHLTLSLSGRGQGEGQVARDALVAAEAARSRAFLKQMGLGDYARPADIPAQLGAREDDLRAQLRRIEEALAGVNLRADRATEVERTLVARRGNLARELETVWEEMLQATPSPAGGAQAGQGGGTARAYVALRRGDTPAWTDLQRLAAHIGAHAALVEFHTLAEQIIALVWRDGWDAPRLIPIPLRQRELIARYLLSYEREVLDHARHVAAGRVVQNDWQTLGEVLLAPLEPALGDATLVYFIPHGVLHLVPLHALTSGGQPFIARRAVAYAPSAAVVEAVVSRQPSAISNQMPDALVMGYTPWARQRATFVGEAEEVAALFGVAPLVDDAATPDALVQRAPQARLIHLSCHGEFVPQDALASAVVLAGGEFTAREWMRLQLDADLVTLSACQLGISERNAGDDLVGMARALLYAGAASLLLTLWSVRADTTKDWMLDFYRRVWRDGNKRQPEAFALRDAMLALRKQNPDPYVWAPFVLIGDWK